MLARYTAPLVNSGERRLPIPAPLHRTRLWNYWFNQSAPVARELSRRLGIAAELIVLQRTRRTPSLKGMSPLLRRKMWPARSAFATRQLWQARRSSWLATSRPAAARLRPALWPSSVPEQRGLSW